MKKKVLIVDDSPNSIILVQSYLDNIDYNIYTAYNGLEACNKAQKIIPDIILMDIQMPVMNGIEATIKIKKNPFTNSIPIILLSSLDKNEIHNLNNTHNFIKLITDYIQKPIEKIKLIEVLQKHHLII